MVADNESIRFEIGVEKGQFFIQVDPEIEIGGMVVVESTPKNFGRVAAQTARQVIQQRIREAERDSQFEYLILLNLPRMSLDVHCHKLVGLF